MSEASKRHSELFATVRDAINLVASNNQLYVDRANVALDSLEEQLEATQRELRDATRMVTAVVATVAPDGRFLRVTPRVLRERYELTRMDDPDGSIVFVASNPASEPETS